jgi:(R)-citramalyl-CoA lyase
MTQTSPNITITDVSPRDGLQNEQTHLTIANKVALIRQLVAARVSRIEIGSFVNPKQVPQMAGTAEVVRAVLPLADHPGHFVALIPNLHGYHDAVTAGVRYVRMVVSATESLNQANFHHSIAVSLADTYAIGKQAASDQVRFGVAIAGAFGCPFEGIVPAERTLTLVHDLLAAGVHEIILGDTTGMAVPTQVFALCQHILALLPADIELCAHFHNTRNTGYANAYAALQAGVCSFDAALGGIGGCPFAPTAVGNVASEDLIHMLHGMGYPTGIDLHALLPASQWLAGQLGHALPALVGKAEPIF